VKKTFTWRINSNFTVKLDATNQIHILVEDSAMSSTSSPYKKDLSISLEAANRMCCRLFKATNYHMDRLDKLPDSLVKGKIKW
jgi:hypothetical protein